jgi:hypothetical protein
MGETINLMRMELSYFSMKISYISDIKNFIYQYGLGIYVSTKISIQHWYLFIYKLGVNLV